MAYSTSAEVQADFKSLVFTSTTLVTSADVAQFIAEADALINSYIGMKYAVPITADADTLNLLKLFSRTLVADRIKKILEVKQASSTSANQDVRGAYSTRDVMTSLNAIRKGELSLSGATSLISGAGFYSQNSTDNVTPEFKKGEKQW
jgi:phage gp36-like protein